MYIIQTIKEVSIIEGVVYVGVQSDVHEEVNGINIWDDSVLRAVMAVVCVGSGCIIEELEYHIALQRGAAMFNFLGFSFDLGGIFVLTSAAEYRNALKFLLVDNMSFIWQEKDAENVIRDGVNLDADMETRAFGCEGLKVLSS